MCSDSRKMLPVYNVYFNAVDRRFGPAYFKRGREGLLLIDAMTTV